MLPACADATDVPAPADSAAQTPGQTGPRRNTHVYDCSDRGAVLSVTTRLGPGELAVWLPAELGGGYFVLGQTRSASGSRYEGDDVMVWIKGEEARFEAQGERLTGCVLNTYRSIWEHARLSGVAFRGIGNEPGWSIEIRERRIDLILDYGARSLTAEFAPSMVQSVAGQTEYQTEIGSQPLLVTIARFPCNDTMSGEPFEAAVTVRLGQQEFHGCGRFLNGQDAS